MSNEYKVRDMLILDENRQKQVTINSGEAKTGGAQFTINAPTPSDRKKIARFIVVEQNGYPSNVYTKDDVFMFTRDAWLNVLIVKHPEWWTNPDDCIDEELKDKLYDEMIKWDTAFQDSLKKNQHPKRGAET